MDKQFWHELDESKQHEILNTKELTFTVFLTMFEQPSWCSYPEALAGACGCWSLLTPGRITSIESCTDCECVTRP